MLLNKQLLPNAFPLNQYKFDYPNAKNLKKSLYERVLKAIKDHLNHIVIYKD